MSAQEKRRYPRLPIKRAWVDVLSVLQAQVVWPNQEISDVQDISYKGLAVTRPGMFPLAAQQSLQVEIELGQRPPFKADARVAWCNMDLVGLEIATVSIDGHLILREYLDAKMAGLNLKPVERAFFGADQTFKFWYQAAGIHVFIWLGPDEKVERVTMQMGDDVVDLTRGYSLNRLSLRERQAFLLLSQIDKPDHPMEEFVRTFAIGE